MVISFWERSKNNVPTKKFLDNLDNVTKLQAIDKLHDYDNVHYNIGNMIKSGQLKNIGQGLYELKIKANESFLRFPVVIKNDYEILLLDGFKKKTNKIPKKDIEKARNLFKEYKIDN